MIGFCIKVFFFSVVYQLTYLPTYLEIYILLCELMFDTYNMFDRYHHQQQQHGHIKITEMNIVFSRGARQVGTSKWSVNSLYI